MPTTRAWNIWVLSAGFLLVFVAVDHASALRPWFGFHHVSPWNPVVGLTFSLIYLKGGEYSGLAILAHALGYFIVSQTMEVELAGLPAAVLAMLPYIAAGLTFRVLTQGAPFGSLGSMVQFIVIGFVAALGAGLIHSSALALSNLMGADNFGVVLWRRSVGDLSGMLSVGALCLLLWRGEQLFERQALFAVQALSIVAVVVFVFGYPFAPTLQLFYLLFLPVLWVALVHGLGGAVVGVVIAQLCIVIAGNIVFPPYTGLTATQAMTIALTITGLVVGMVVTEWRRSARWQREQQAALERSLRLRSVGEVAAVIGHELNQPLTAIGTYAKVSRDALEAGDGGRAKAILDKLIGQCARANEVMLSFRNLLRRGEVNRETVSLPVMARELVALIADECRSKNITVDVRIPPGFPTLEADRIQLQQALLNLLRNSIEAIAGAGRRGEIVLSADLDESGQANIVVADDGPGFQRGFGSIAGTPFVTSKSDGTGLGLAVARTVAEAHSGSFTVLERVSGAAVRLRLPVKGKSQ